MKKTVVPFVFILLCALLLSCGFNEEEPISQSLDRSSSPGIPDDENASSQGENSEQGARIIDPTQNTLATRFILPKGFTRTDASEYGDYIRNLQLHPDKSPVLLYNGEEKQNQSAHMAVFDIDVGTRDLQQCADAALRIRCEFLFSTNRFEMINYHLTNGDEFPYTAYRDGYRLEVDGNKTSLVKTSEYNDGYETFRKYLDVLFTYAGTISIQAESELIHREDMQIGDVFVLGGSPGHCVIVVDLAENQDGEKIFLLAQSFMPAQQIHVLKNPESDSSWYSLDELEYPFVTPEWTFSEPCLRRMP